MTDHTRHALKELQNLDEELRAAREEIEEVNEAIADVDAPAESLEGEVERARGRLQELRVEERRVELSAREKASRIERLDERLQGVRNVREEAAVSAELEMVRRALEADEQEGYSLIDQLRKLEQQVEELQAALVQAREEIGPRKSELESERDRREAEIAALVERRAAFVAEMPGDEVRMYEGIRKGGQRRAVAPLTDDGACGHCFTMLPLQLQNEVRHGTTLIRCEGCGVILAQPSPDPEEGDEAVSDGAAADGGTEAETDADG